MSYVRTTLKHDYGGVLGFWRIGGAKGNAAETTNGLPTYISKTPNTVPPSYGDIW
jgi:hypothetical protein